MGEDSSFLQLLMLQFYHSLTRDSMHALYIYIDLLNSYFRLTNSTEHYDISQLRLMRVIFRYQPHNFVLSCEHMKSLLKRAESFFDRKLNQNAAYLQRLLYEPTIRCLAEIDDMKVLRNIAALIHFIGVPLNVMNRIDIGDNKSEMGYLKLVLEMRKLNYSTEMTMNVTKILNARIR